MPIVPPSRSPIGTLPRSAQRPCRTSSVNAARRFTRCSVSASTPSATARVPLPGARTTSRGARSRKAPSTTASALTIAPTAMVRSSALGLATKESPSPRMSVTSAGSTAPRATTTGRSTSTSSPVAEGRARHRRNLLPGAALGRRGCCRDDFGDMVGVIGCGVAAFPADHRDEELPRLDDLEVVVAHAVAGARLEVRVVAEVGVTEDGGVAAVRAAAADADPQFVHLLEVPGGGAFGAVYLEAEPALWADDDP